MSSNTYIRDALIRHQIYIQRFSKGQSNKLVKKLKKIIKQINNEIKISKKDKVLSVERLIQLRMKINTLIDQIDIISELEDDLKGFSKHEVSYLEKLIDSSAKDVMVLRTAPEMVYATVSKKPIILTSTTGKIMKKTINKLVAEFSDKAKKDIVNQIRIGVIEGQSLNTIVANVSHITKKRTRREIEALVRTIINHIGTESRKVMTNANYDIFKGEKYTATLDSRTTLRCASLDGKIFKIGKGPYPPIHWNCRSIRVPIVKDEYNLSGLKGKRGSIGADGRKTVSSDTTYQSWLRKQPKEFQEDILGKERAKLFRSGKLPLNRFVDESGKTIKLSELQQLS